jgi:flagellar biosynthesis GTPase FlhF
MFRRLAAYGACVVPEIPPGVITETLAELAVVMSFSAIPAAMIKSRIIGYLAGAGLGMLAAYSCAVVLDSPASVLEKNINIAFWFPLVGVLAGRAKRKKAARGTAEERQRPEHEKVWGEPWSDEDKQQTRRRHEDTPRQQRRVREEEEQWQREQQRRQHEEARRQQQREASERNEQRRRQRTHGDEGGPWGPYSHKEKRGAKETTDTNEEGQWWEVLGVSPGASWEETKTAYREMMKRYHPDRVEGLVAPVIENDGNF